SELQEKINGFYRVNYWDKVQGDGITNQGIAMSFFDFAVNAGVGTSALLAQVALGIKKTDGVIGADTLNKLNAAEPPIFIQSFKLAKIARYIALVKKDRTYQKFFFGWVRRAIE